jgi:flagellar hook protein FlgE
MLRSLFSGVSGLKTNQTKMDVIGNNIANVNTYGFKGSRVTFRDMYYQTLSGSSNASGNMGGGNSSQIGYGTSVGSVDLLNTRSGFASTGQGMDCYINGEGYFVVKDGTGNERLTQVGTFSFDGSGNLVDGQKNFVCGYPVKSITGKVSISGASVDFGKTNGTELNGYTLVVKHDDAGDTTPKVTADKAKKTITVTVKTGTDITKGTLQDALKDPTAWTWANDTTGNPAKPAGLVNEAATVDGAADPQIKNDKIADTSGMIAPVGNFDYTAAPVKIVNPFGELTGVTIGADGTITGQDTKGTIQIIGQIALANVPNPQALTLEGSSYFKAVNNTGTITYSSPGSKNVGALKTGGLEMSNVDLATEFSDMIMTQRGFQASSKIITVSDEMLEELVNLKR